jgi:predicted secreted protein
MSLFNGIVLYTMIWWVVIFAVLPCGIKHSPHQDKGHAAGAPTSPNMKRKFLYTSLIALVVWGLVYSIITYDIITVDTLDG